MYENNAASLRFSFIAWLIARCQMSAVFELGDPVRLKEKRIALFRTRVSLLCNILFKFSFFVLVRAPEREKRNLFAEIKMWIKPIRLLQFHYHYPAKISPTLR